MATPQPKSSLTGILCRFGAAKKRKETKRELMQCVDDVLNPDDRDYAGELVNDEQDSNDSSGSRVVDIVDTSAGDLLREHTAFTVGSMFNPTEIWFNLGFKESTNDLRIWSAISTRILYELIGRSNYYQELVETKTDTDLHGHAVLSIEEDKDNFAFCRTENPYSCYFTTNWRDEVIEVFVERSVPIMSVLEEFGDDMDEELKSKLTKLVADNSNQSCGVVMAYMKNKPSLFPDLLKSEDINKGKYVCFYVLKEYGSSLAKAESCILRKTFYRSKSIIPNRDRRNRNHPYGFGEGRLLLPQARVSNAIMKDVLNSAKLRLDPPLTGDATALENIEGGLKAGQKFPVTTTTREGLVQPLSMDLGMQDGLAAYELVQRSLAQKLPLSSDIYKVARQSIQEIQERLGERTRKLAPTKVRFLNEGVKCHIMRFFDIAKRKGLLPPLPEGANLKNLDITFDTLLLKEYKQAKALQYTQFMGYASPVISVSPQSADKVDFDKMLEDLADSTGVADTLRLDSVVEQVREERNKKIAEQQQLDTQRQLAETNKLGADALSTTLGRQEGL